MRPLGGFVNLQTLYLNNNYFDFAEFDSDYFLDDLSLLEHLDLSYNYFYNLSRDYFKHLKSLKTLRLKEISSSLFVENTRLVMLNLSSNSFNTITPLNLTMLEFLDLNCNQVKSFEFYLPHLRQLYLADNQIEAVNLRDIISLDSVGLSSNLFRSLNDSIVVLEVRDLRSFKMNGSYRVWRQENPQPKSIDRDGPKFVCHFGYELQSPQIGTYTIQESKKFQKIRDPLKLRFKRGGFVILSKINSPFFIFLLILKYSSSTKLDRISLENFQNLTKLDLSHNQLAYHLNEYTFSKLGKLIYLDLSYNRIRDVNVDIFKWLRTLVFLNIEHNYICNIEHNYQCYEG